MELKTTLSPPAIPGSVAGSLLIVEMCNSRLSVMAVRRALRVSRYVRRWNSQRMLYWMLVFHTIVRVLSYTFIVIDAVLNNVLDSNQETVESMNHNIQVISHYRCLIFRTIFHSMHSMCEKSHDHNYCCLSS